MARIRELKQSDAGSRVHPTEVECGWQVLRDPSGGLLLQLSTYGSDTRESEPKVSQTLQIDRAVARQLVDIIENVFES